MTGPRAKNMRIAITASLLLCFSISSQAVDPVSQLSTDELMKQVSRVEAEAMRSPEPRWMYFLTDEKENLSTVRLVLETREGTISEVICRNRQSLSLPEKQAERQHLQQLASNPREQQKHFRREAKDQARIAELIRMLSGGFRFETLGAAGNLIRLRFYPSPTFRPSNIDQRIFHAMTGTVLVDPRRKRLARITGYFLRDVDFGAGLLGKVKQGGAVDIVRQDTGEGDWNPVELHVGVKARVLFKSLEVHRNLRFWGFQPVRAGMSINDGVRFLAQQPTDGRSCDTTAVASNR
jgi:hypothetical protein